MKIFSLFHDKIIPMEDKDATIRSLQEQNRELHERNRNLQEQVTILTGRVCELERRLQTDSSTSSKPPSSDGLSKKPRTKSLREKGKAKSGGQIGHQGKTLEMSASPDKVINYSVSSCKGCGKDLSTTDPHHVERRQVFDIPKPQIEVTEHCSEQKRCGCGAVTKAAFPESISAPVQYGPRVRAMCVYFNHQQLIPEGRVAEIFEDIFDLPVATATVATYGSRAADSLTDWLSNLYSTLATCGLKHLDETGYRIAGKTQWLHVVSNESATYYRPSRKRGEMFKGLSGTVVHDHFSSYYTILDVLHSLCNAHHLRELRALTEIEKESWASRMAILLRYANKHRDAIDRIHQVYDVIVGKGLAFHESLPPVSVTAKRGRKKRRTGHNLLLRLKNHKEEVLRFMTSDSLPFTNNQAEQDLRMMKVRMKISGSFRSFRGAEVFAAIRSYSSTCQKRGINIIKAIEGIFLGQLPTLPAPST